MPSEVYTGFWINWTEGQIRGSTVTISTAYGAYLVAFLALFVRWIGFHLWRISCFVIFQLKSRAKSEDILYHQQQVILRNSTNDSGAAIDLVRIGWSWRTRTKKPLLRSLGLLFWACLHGISISAAGIFSSKVTSTTSEVLIRSSNCGTWSTRRLGDFILNSTNLDNSISNLADSGASIERSFEYTAMCLVENPSNSAQCLPYGRQQVSWKTTVMDSCPFESQMCRSPTIELDTGYMDSHLQFGINSPPEDRIQFRHVAQCALLTMEGFQSPLLTAAEAEIPDWAYTCQDESFLQFYYGNTSYSNATYVFGDHVFSLPLTETDPKAYDLQTQYASLDGAYSNTFTPITPLNRSDADISVVFLANNVIYTGAVSDPWFNAPTVSTETNETAGSGLPTYRAKHLVSVLGCTDQFQACAHEGGDRMDCTELTGGAPFGDALIKLASRRTPKATTIATRILLSAGDSISTVVLQLHERALLANRLSAGVFAPPLPQNQWIQELNQMFGTGLVNMQKSLTEFVSGPEDASNDQYITSLYPQEEWMCSNQITSRENYASFSVLGLCIIIIIGALIVIVNLLLPRIFSRLQRGSSKGRYRDEEWQIDNVYQLQRIAYEAQQLGQWEGHRDYIPVTVQGQTFYLPSKTLLSEGNQKMNSESNGAGSDDPKKPNVTVENKAGRGSADTNPPSLTDNIPTSPTDSARSISAVFETNLEISKEL